MIGTQGEHDAEAAGSGKRHQKINKRTAISLLGFGQQLLELIHDQESFRFADRQIAADRISRLARVRGIDALAQGSASVGGPSEPLGRFGDPPFQIPR